MSDQVDALEVMDWVTLAVMVGFYGWLVYLVASTFVPIAGAVLGVAGSYLLLNQIDERRQRRKHRADNAARARGEFDRPLATSKPVSSTNGTTTTTTEDEVWEAGK